MEAEILEAEFRPETFKIEFPGDPLGFGLMPASDIFKMDYEEVVANQLKGARAQFRALRPLVPVLDTLAREQGINDFSRIEDIAPLLLSYHVYKSYPLRVLEKGDYARLTSWLNGLVSYDLSALDASGCDSLDSWNALLEAETPLRVHVAPGPSGKLGFLPRDTTERRLQVNGTFVWIHQGIEGESNADLRLSDLAGLPCLFFNYRKGPHQQRIIDALVETVYNGDESKVYALYPGTMTLEVMSLAGRLRAAEERGTKVAISPGLQAQRLEFVEQERNRPAQTAEFFERVSRELDGRRILFYGSWSSLLEAADLARDRNAKWAFAPDSLITTGGGYKGGNFEGNWYERLVEFLGVPGLHDSYAGAEQMLAAQYCPADHYHLHPLTIPFILDPDSGALREREGTQTGRFAFLNLAARSAWGGFVTGDEVTITWDERCSCGRTGPYIHRAIRPYDADRGGEDKISCAGMPTAHRRAMDYLADM